MDPKVLQALLSTPAEGEDAFIATLKNLDDEKRDAAIASFRIQKGMKDLVDADLMAQVSKAAGYEAKASKTEADKPAPTKVEKTADKQVDLSNLDPAIREQLESVFKSHAEAVQKAAKVDELMTVVKSLQDEKETQRYVAKAASFEFVPGSTDEIVQVLKSAHQVDSKLGETIEGIFGRMSELVRKSNMVSTIGAARRAEQGGAWSKIEALADGMVQKSSDASFTKDQALDKVLKTDKGAELYREYLGENAKQRGEVY